MLDKIRKIIGIILILIVSIPVTALILCCVALVTIIVILLIPGLSVLPAPDIRFGGPRF